MAALTLSLLMWLTAFLSVGNEYFLMWQSKEWTGQSIAQHMFADRRHHSAVRSYA